MDRHQPILLKTRLKRMGKEAAELPLLRIAAKPLYRRWFRQPYRNGNAYYGIYPSHALATADAQALSSQALPSHYNVNAAGQMYRSQLRQLRLCDYPVLHWLERRLASGTRSIYDLGGHIGLAYYGLRRYLPFPESVRWTVHDVAEVMAQGRQWAQTHDLHQQLYFSEDPRQANGCDLLLCSGSLQYLDYGLVDLLQSLSRPPPAVIINLTPLHEETEFFTLQNLGIAICPYRISSLPELLSKMERLGYRVVDQWSIASRSIQIPFASPYYNVHCYYGIYFQRQDIATFTRKH